MPESPSFTLHKEERIFRKKLIQRLFEGRAGHALSAYPLRVTYRTEPVEEDGVLLRMLVSVPKRHLKHAVARNRVKRQVREAFRKNKQIVLTPLAGHPETAVNIAFIWTSDRQFPSPVVEEKVANLMRRIGERL